MGPDATLPSIIALAGGEIVGRVRLQKMVFLLKQCGAPANFVFRYHHYGPYSREIDYALDKAKGQDLLEEQIRNRSGDGAAYSVFRLKGVGSDYLDQMPSFQSLVGDMNSRSSLILEISATIFWLATVEMIPDWRKELRIRKGSKVTEDRERQALQLLESYGLGMH